MRNSSCTCLVPAWQISPQSRRQWSCAQLALHFQTLSSVSQTKGLTWRYRWSLVLTCALAGLGTHPEVRHCPWSHVLAVYLTWPRSADKCRLVTRRRIVCEQWACLQWSQQILDADHHVTWPCFARPQRLLVVGVDRAIVYVSIMY